MTKHVFIIFIIFSYMFINFIFARKQALAETR